jgi:hypothetical protein
LNLYTWPVQIVGVKPYDQLVLKSDTTIGDCWRACIASILEVPPEEIPHFMEIDMRGGDSFYITSEAWLNERGLTLCHDVSLPENGGFCIYCDVSPRGGGHAVVGNADELVEVPDKPGVKIPTVAHDPHPSRDGVLFNRPVYYWFESKT